MFIFFIEIKIFNKLILAKRSLENEEDDDLCVQAAEKSEMIELLNDGQSQVFRDIPDQNEFTENTVDVLHVQPSIQEHQAESNIHFMGQNESKWTPEVKASIEQTYKTKIFAKPYLLDFFFHSKIGHRTWLNYSFVIMLPCIRTAHGIKFVYFSGVMEPLLKIYSH